MAKHKRCSIQDRTTFRDLRSRFAELIESVPFGRLVEPAKREREIEARFVNPPREVHKWFEKERTLASDILRVIRYYLASQPDRISGSFFDRIDGLLDGYFEHGVSSMEISREALEKHDDLDAEDEMDLYAGFANDFLKILGELAAEFPAAVVATVASQESGIGTPSADQTTITSRQAAARYGCSLKRLQNVVSQQKRKTGHDYAWILRAGRQKGFSVDQMAFDDWMREGAKKRGRPPGSNPRLNRPAT